MLVWPSSSFARTVTVWLPSASNRRESVFDVPVCTTLPSTVNWYSPIAPPSGSVAVAVNTSVLPATAVAWSTASVTAGGALTVSVTVDRSSGAVARLVGERVGPE